jgi:hypothetical protein
VVEEDWVREFAGEILHGVLIKKIIYPSQQQHVTISFRMTRYAILRLTDARTLVAKEPESPVVRSLKLADDLTPAQMRHLCVATPYAPVMVDADVKWDVGRQVFEAVVLDVEVAPRVPQAKVVRKARMQKRKRGLAEL